MDCPGAAGGGRQFLLIAFAFGCLTTAFVANDFSVLYVAQHSNTLLPTLYRIAAVWGGHEGSLLLWVLMLVPAGALAVALLAPACPKSWWRACSACSAWSAGFLLFILFTSNPFDRLLPGAEEGRDLNPLLQDPGPGHPSADALHGLRRLLGGLRLRHRRAAFGPARRRLGALVAAVDHGGLGLPDPGHRARLAGGPTTNWAGAAGGSGIRSRTPPSCPGWSARR
jgi:hypothetical protein